MFNFEFIRDNWLFVATGIGETLGVVIFSFLLAVPIAMTVAKGCCSTFLPINALSRFYVWLIDGIPLLLQIFFIFLALPQLRIFLPGFWAAVLVLAVNYGSRLSKIFYERFTGKSQGEIWTSLLPPLTNELANMIKDSTLISVTGFLHDVMWRTTKVGRTEFHMLEAFTIAAIIYLILFTIVSLGGKALTTIMTTSESSSQVST
jgi:polar amino acid transport system permease protein